MLRKGFLLCIDSDAPVAPDNNDICPVHKSMACVRWFVPWPQAREATAPSAELVQVGWYGPYGVIPGGMDNEPREDWRPLYVER